MNGDRRKRKQTLDKFISALVKKREEFRKEKKTGAGSATEAIEFYQYVISKNTTWKAKVGKKSSKDIMRSLPVGKNKVEAEVTTSSDGRDEELKEDQHDTTCQVCGDEGDELLCCSTCNLAFHLECVRPALSEMPEGEWSCAFCDATGVTDLKKDSRQRKRAVVAVREMNQLKVDMAEDSAKGVSENSTEESNAKDLMENRCKVCSKTGDLIHCSQKSCHNQFHVSCLRPEISEKPDDDWNCPYCDIELMSGLKRQVRSRRAATCAIKAMEKLAQEQEDATKHTDDSLPMAKSLTPSKRKDQIIDVDTPVHPGRPRQQRLKVNIGTQHDKEEDGAHGTDDDMKTTGRDDDNDEDNDDVDEGLQVAQMPQAPTFTRDQIPPDVVKKLAPKATNSNSRHGQYHCKYCMDDETTETCCFCACRVCFTKHGKQNIILCDLCDGEYHINCLSPPLSEIPSFDWYCPTCTEAITKALKEPSSRATQSKKGGKAKGTKSVSKIPTKKGATKAKAKLALKQKKSAYSALQPRTASGRFAPKPKPGETVDAPVVKRGPGRPPKSAYKGSPEKKTIRKKLDKLDATPQSPGSGLVNKTLQQRSRSGRVVKRKAAYDEREEGAQLLKVPKVAAEEFGVDDETTTATKAVPSAAATLAANTVISLSKDEISDIPLLDVGAQKLTQSDILDQPDIVDSSIAKQTKSSLSFPDEDTSLDKPSSSSKHARRKPGARECMQISRRFGSGIIPQNYMDILMVSLIVSILNILRNLLWCELLT